jgi:hypothetical protein
MSTSGSRAEGLSAKLVSLVVVPSFLLGLGVGVAGGVIAAKKGGPVDFTIEVGGNKIGVDVKESQITLTEFINHLESEEPKGFATVLQAHGFYRVPSIEAAKALRQIEETEDTREFVQLVRGILYDLAGPFKRPETLLDAPDDRVISALNDLFDRKPASPVLAKLWEESLNWTGIFSVRKISISIREDKTLRKGIGATCAGSILLNRDSQVSADEEGGGFTLHIAETRPCSPTSPLEMLAGKAAAVWISPHDMSALTEPNTSTEPHTSTPTKENDLRGTLFAMPIYLTTPSEPQ